jgi:predicted hotdog family 3-hydroxylacyl-ACP dehydratase
VAEAFPSVETLLPHRGPALLIEAVDALSADGITCWGLVPSESPFAADGWAPSFLGLEMGAQAAALFEALRREHQANDAAPRLGYLVGIRHAQLAADLPVGRRLRVTVRPAGGAGPLGVYDVSVGEDGVEFARGSLSTYAA